MAAGVALGLVAWLLAEKTSGEGNILRRFEVVMGAERGSWRRILEICSVSPPYLGVWRGPRGLVAEKCGALVVCLRLLGMV